MHRLHGGDRPTVKNVWGRRYYFNPHGSQLYNNNNNHLAAYFPGQAG